MITQETAGALWSCWREIAAGEKLLADMQAEIDKPFGERDRTAATLRDAFGRKRHLELGIPSGDSGHRILGVDPELARSIIRAHIAKKQALLVEINERARVELEGGEA